MSAAYSLDELEVLPAHEIPARYNTNVSDDATEVSGSAPGLDNNDEEYDKPVGSGPELGGIASGARTYASTGEAGSGVNDPDTVNLTGMTESPMVAESVGPNINGSGADTQQVGSRSFASQAVQEAAHAISKISSGLGASLASSFLAPKSSASSVTVLQQTNQHGLGKSGNMLLFFMIGVLIALIVFE